MIRAFTNYLSQRPFDKKQLINIDKNSLAFFEEDEIREKD